MMICSDCRDVFENPVERWNSFGVPYSDFLEYLCPSCSSEAIDETITCDCGNDEMHPEEMICDDCKLRIKEFYDSLTEWELYYFRDIDDLATS